GSPTILINGQDVAGASLSEGADSCRIYWDETGCPRGVPSSETILAGLLKAKQEDTASHKGKPAIFIARKFPFFEVRGPGTTRSGKFGASEPIDSLDKIPERTKLKSLSVLPSIGLAVLPKVTCPACWPAYAAILSSLGLGFINYTPYLLPLTGGFMLLAVASLGYRAKRRRGYKPFVLSLLAALILMIGKFGFESDAIMYGGIALFLAASLWNAWPQRKTAGGPCPACVSSESLT
ncbi:MAG: MerC family mercury resistance protein, partial [Candidatus Tectomicrobia bacterium]|nr:MerC family mercury resistance protein [Candidatus Tectomicrobia bacterium]